MRNKVLVPLFLGFSSLFLFSLLGLDWTARAGGPWYVSPIGNDSHNCLSLMTACRTIAAAINKAASGDTIIVGGSRYLENLIIDKNLTINGAGKNITIIDGRNNAQNVLHINEGIDVTVTDLTITNGNAAIGGGIYNAGMLTLIDSRVISNTSNEGSGIVNLDYALLTRVIVQDNEGSAIVNYAGGVLNIEYSNIRSNSGYDGGGINNQPGGTVNLVATTIEGNYASTGGGITNSGILNIDHSNIISNTAHGGEGGLFLAMVK